VKKDNIRKTLNNTKKIYCRYPFLYFIEKIYFFNMHFWGLGIGDWGLGIGPNPQSPIPNPQSPIPNVLFK
jgi:hypothetical protein